MQQNIAPRTITGCVKMSDINDLHNECEMLTLKAHTEMLVEQFLAGSYQSHRADHETTSSTSLCPMRPTLNDTYRDHVKQHTNNKEQLNRKEYKNALKSIHRHKVHTQLNKDSKQLGTLPPQIAEQTLSRIPRIRLAELRTGYCPLLSSYLSRICNNVDNRCSKCDLAPHDVNHILTAVRIPRT